MQSDLYQVIARRWRPRTFDEVVGQKHVVETLKRAIEKGKIVHSYLFAGPRGVGKTSMARILAKALNCENGPTPSPCCSCDACLSIEKGTFVDVVEMDAASNRGIEEIRALRESVKYASVRGRYRVYIIDEVHMLTEAAFNALLKTLEEPPEGVVFVFATTEPKKIPQTILSRCVRFDFKPLTQEEAVHILKKICEREGVSYEEEALRIIAKAAGGSLRDAEMLLEQAILFTDGNIKRDRVYEILGLVDSLVVEDFLKALMDRDLDGVLDVFHSQVLGRGYDVGGFLSALLDEVVERLKDAARSGNTELAVKYYTFSKVFLRLAEEVRRHPFPEMLMEAEIIRLVSLPPIESVVSLLKGERAASEPVVPETVRSDERIKQVSDVVQRLVDAVAKDKPYVATVLQNAEVVCQNGLVVIRPGGLKRIGWDRLNEELPYLRDKAKELGCDLMLEGEIQENSVPLSRAELKERARKDPAVQKVLELFPEAVIVDIKRRDRR